MNPLEVATLLGAHILEKHFTHDRTLPDNDHYHAMDKDDLKLSHERMQFLLGNGVREPLEGQQLSRANERRGLAI